MKNRKRYLRYKARLRRYNKFGTTTKGECPICGSEEIFYYFRYDAVSCLNCNNWLEKACTDPNCTYCRNRPDSPLEGLFNEGYVYPERKDWLRSNYQRKHSGKLLHEKR